MCIQTSARKSSRWRRAWMQAGEKKCANAIAIICNGSPRSRLFFRSPSRLHSFPKRWAAVFFSRADRLSTCLVSRDYGRLMLNCCLIVFVKGGVVKFESIWLSRLDASNAFVGEGILMKRKEKNVNWVILVICRVLNFHLNAFVFCLLVDFCGLFDFQVKKCKSLWLLFKNNTWRSWVIKSIRWWWFWKWKFHVWVRKL